MTYTDILPNGIKRGYKVKSKIDGFTGIVTTICYMLNGSIMLGVRPPSEGNDRKKLEFADYHTFEIVDEGVSAGLQPVDTLLGYSLGDYVRDKITNFEGTVVEVDIQLNGCVDFVICPKIKPKKALKDFKMMNVDQHRLEMVEKKAVETTKTATLGGCADFSRD